MRRPYYLMPFAAFLVALAGCLLCAGCLAFDPGGQVRTGLKQEKTYEWTSEGTIRVHGVGPQTERFLMLEGDIAMTAEGEVDWANSAITHYLQADPSAADAAGALPSAFDASVRALAEGYKLLGKALDKIPGGTADEDEDDGG